MGANAWARQSAPAAGRRRRQKFRVQRRHGGLESSDEAFAACQIREGRETGMNNMNKLLSTALVAAAVLGVAAAGFAAPPPTQVRGEITSIAGDTVTIKTYSGRTVELMLQPQTHYSAVLPAQL